MQRRQDEVPRFSSHQGRIHGRPVAHLTDEDDVRVLAQGLADALGKVREMRSQFALRNQGGLALFDVFDRVFQGDDVARPPFIDGLQDAPQGRRLAAARGTADQDQALCQPAEALQQGPVAIRRQGRQGIEEAYRRVEAGVFLADMEAAAQGPAPGKGAIPHFVPGPADSVQQAAHVVFGQRRTGKGTEALGQAKHGRPPRLQVKVRRLLTDGLFHQCRYVHRASPPSQTRRISGSSVQPAARTRAMTSVRRTAPSFRAASVRAATPARLRMAVRR